MKIYGFQKTTLLDYPEKVAATVFTGGCNFCCPFCQNGDLVRGTERLQRIPEEQVLKHLEKRRNLLDGVCVTGGEPTIQPDLKEFLRKVKDIGLLVKLDTNGYRPKVLMELSREGLLNYVAMDIKGAPEQYEEIAGIKPWDVNRIQASIGFLMSGKIPYEFRTTVVREYHTAENLCRAARWIFGAKAYYLQNFQESDRVLMPGLHGYLPDELHSICLKVRDIIPNTRVRGVDSHADFI